MTSPSSRTWKAVYIRSWSTDRLFPASEVTQLFGTKEKRDNRIATGNEYCRLHNLPAVWITGDD